MTRADWRLGAAILVCVATALVTLHLLVWALLAPVTPRNTQPVRVETGEVRNV